MRSEVLYLAPKLRKKATDLIHLTEFFEWKEPQWFNKTQQPQQNPKKALWRIGKSNPSQVGLFFPNFILENLPEFSHNYLT